MWYCLRLGAPNSGLVSEARVSLTPSSTSTTLVIGSERRGASRWPSPVHTRRRGETPLPRVPSRGPPTEVVDQRVALEHKVAARPARGASGEDPGACAGRELVEPPALLRRLQRRQRRLELRHPRPQRPLANTSTTSSSSSASSASGRRLDGRRRADRHAAAEGTGRSPEVSVACARARLAGEDRRRMTAPCSARDLVDSVNVS